VNGDYDLIFTCVAVYLAVMPALAVVVGRMLAARDRQIPVDVAAGPCPVCGGHNKANCILCRGRTR
jgi:hypothetical protein